MNGEMQPFNLFQHGSTWVRADFHLHTREDEEFKYEGEDNNYYSEYIKALHNAGTSVGVITNHNKFKFEEFKALRKTAKKKEIFLDPVLNYRSTMVLMESIQLLFLAMNGLQMDRIILIPF